MGSWVEEDAKRWALVYHHGREVWRNLKLNLEQAITDYTRIYTPAGTQEFQYTDCMPVTEDCVRIRALSNNFNKAEKSIEVRFQPDTYAIEVDKKTAFSIRLNNEGKEVVLRKADQSAEEISIEDASKQLLKPLFALIPQRRPNI